MKKKLFCIVLLSMTGSASAVATCPDGKSAITKPGYFGVLNVENYNVVNSATKPQDNEKLSALLSENAAIEIPSGVEVCIKDAAFQWYRTQITIPGKHGAYWVPDNALNKIK
ncbi:hypothetical protein [Shimwellia blattae]|uniref:Lipoprotein n=1 Tax=Shimwellia blattae (strain ATCC 29907 / DSM 4481 / JCM 1650 / NBRC 105725 / CDC 9005-74) TaxID=630626 RepID=I2B5E9_SHIBC|nr:hypothetical protein [Shimwellia blattae]AFJ45753.1 hypothetical protein EBL_c06280 [Shimwellia blattae DSM 4481 = NBRC 105725]